MSAPMKVASFNANSIRARLPIVLSWLRKESPHVLCLQETKVPDKDFPVQAFADIGYHAVFRGEKAYNGVAILSTEKPQKVHHGFHDDGSAETRLIEARVFGITVVNTYVPQGLSPLSPQFREKLDWLQRLLTYFRSRFRPEEPLLWAGDFNIAPGPEDVYDPLRLQGSVGFHPDEHAILGRLRDWGFVDLLRRHRPEPGLFTFWDYRIRNSVKKNLGWRIDHLWATRPLAEQSLRAWVAMEPRLAEKPSDHTFVAAEFSISSSSRAQ